MQWSISLKRLLVPGSDNAQLAELLLQQALVGSSPNHLMLSYLKHALTTHIVSQSAALRQLVQFSDINKAYSLRVLLDLVIDLTPRLSLCGCDEDSLALAVSILYVYKWLYDVTYKALQKLEENPSQQEYSVLIEKCCTITGMIMEDSGAKALLCVARLDEPEVGRDIDQSTVNIRAYLGQVQKEVIDTSLRESLEKSLWTTEKLVVGCEEQTLLDVSHQPLNLTLNALLTQEAVLNPTNDITSFAEQIHIVEKTQGLSRPELYCEMFRTCLLGVIDAAGGQDEIKWAAFAFLKLPQVIVSLATGSATASAELESGVNLLLAYTPLLDLADTKCGNCDTLNFLLSELANKYSMLSEAQIKAFSTRRVAESQKGKVNEQGGAQQQSIGLILRAEPTVQSILKTLDAEYSRNQDALLGVLCHMLSGKSFELILAAAAATGRLQSFAIKLIKFNEFAKKSSGVSVENPKAAGTRALLFDITFLMLCHIMQLYGTEIISTAGPDAANSFFVQWTMRCLPEDGKYKSLELLSPADHGKVELLLRQLSPGEQLETNQTKWHEISHNTPYAIQEVLFAWEHGVLNNDKIKNIMDNVKSRMCCLPVVVSAWLCSYINISDDDIRKKPRSMLQHLVKPLALPDTANMYYNERSHLMQIILQRMIQGVLPRGAGSRTSPYTLPPNTSAYEVLMETFRACVKNSSVNLKAIHMFDNLILVGGAKWFCEHVVRETLSHNRIEDVNRALSLAVAVFHMDLESLTLSLLHRTIPSLLHADAPCKLALLTDPRGSALAKLAVMCLTTVHKMRTLQKDTAGVRRGRKRTRTDVEMDDDEEDAEDDRPNKLRRLPIHDDLSLGDSGFNLGDLLSAREEPDVGPMYDAKDNLNKTMVNLFRLFGNVVCANKVCQKTGFVMAFITECVHAGPVTARFLLQFMPLSLVAQLVKVLPTEFTSELLLSVCDLTTTKSRRITTKILSQRAKWYHIRHKSAKPTPMLT